MSRYALGDWNFICDRCGSERKASEAILDHDNYRVCQRCYDPPHETYHTVKEDPSVPWTRTVTENKFVQASGVGIWSIGINFTVPPYRDVDALFANGSTVRVRCFRHGFASLDTITIRGASDNAFDGSFEITVLDLDHFLYTADSTPVSDEDPAIGVTADGIIKDTNLATFNRWMANEWKPA